MQQMQDSNRGFELPWASSLLREFEPEPQRLGLMEASLYLRLLSYDPCAETKLTTIPNLLQWFEPFGSLSDLIEVPSFMNEDFVGDAIQHWIEFFSTAVFDLAQLPQFDAQYYAQKRMMDPLGWCQELFSKTTRYVPGAPAHFLRVMEDEYALWMSFEQALGSCMYESNPQPFVQFLTMFSEHVMLTGVISSWFAVCVSRYIVYLLEKALIHAEVFWQSCGWVPEFVWSFNTCAIVKMGNDEFSHVYAIMKFALSVVGLFSPKRNLQEDESGTVLNQANLPCSVRLTPNTTNPTTESRSARRRNRKKKILRAVSQSTN
jgi:hypothetical protein